MNNNSWEKLKAQDTVKLYAGDIPSDVEYKELIGLSLNICDIRHIKHDITCRFPVTDNSVDGFQAEDVFEHIAYDRLVPVINEIYRILKQGALFRLSLPDYGCDVLQKRSVKNAAGDIIYDPGGGGTPENRGHLWFPRIDNVKRLLDETAFARHGKIEYLHFYNMDGTFVLNSIDYSKGHIKRTPDHDDRVKNPYRPMSIVIDLIKMRTR